MTDSLQRFLFEGAPVRGEIVHLDATWRAVLERHDYPEPLRTTLGELMAAAALLSATIKFTGSLILQVQGSGPVKLIVVECTSDQTMRATAKWDGELPAGGFRALVGNGRFAITIAPNDARQTYQGVVSLEGESVAATLEHYMASSEQLETRLWLASDPNQAAGLLLQRLPGSSAADPDAWNRAVRLGETVTTQELLGLPARQIVHRLYHEEDIRVFEARVVSFRCSCSRERVVNMLRMLGREEVRSILQERGAVDVSCEFCNRRYAFDAVDAEQIFASEVVTRAGSTRH
ncbi:MAG TPA: Hsp33 family molecular chaperone HslO [Burkholderiales bacterium]|nr:Hsp33 family molecular chaperone HslO [Burkholderiales bacterium]